MDIDSFTDEFKFYLWLIPATTPDAAGFKIYMRQVSALRSWSIYKLRSWNVPGYRRSRFNNYIDRLMPGFKQYLYRHSPYCALCGNQIFGIEYATIDHIIERGAGGPKGINNQQLAHDLQTC